MTALPPMMQRDLAILVTGAALDVARLVADVEAGKPVDHRRALAVAEYAVSLAEISELGFERG